MFQCRSCTARGCVMLVIPMCAYCGTDRVYVDPGPGKPPVGVTAILSVDCLLGIAVLCPLCDRVPSPLYPSLLEPRFQQPSLGFLCQNVLAKLGVTRARVPATNIAFGMVKREDFRPHLVFVLQRVLKFHGGDGDELLGQFSPRGPPPRPILALPLPPSPRPQPLLLPPPPPPLPVSAQGAMPPPALALLPTAHPSKADNSALHRMGRGGVAQPRLQRGSHRSHPVPSSDKRYMAVQAPPLWPRTVPPPVVPPLLDGSAMAASGSTALEAALGGSGESKGEAPGEAAGDSGATPASATLPVDVTGGGGGGGRPKGRRG